MIKQVSESTRSRKFSTNRLVLVLLGLMILLPQSKLEAQDLGGTAKFSIVATANTTKQLRGTKSKITQLCRSRKYQARCRGAVAVRSNHHDGVKRIRVNISANRLGQGYKSFFNLLQKICSVRGDGREKVNVLCKGSYSPRFANGRDVTISIEPSNLWYSASVWTHVLPDPPRFESVGDSIQLTYEVINDLKRKTLRNIRVSDPLIGRICEPFLIWGNSAVKCTANYVVTAEDVSSGEIAFRGVIVARNGSSVLRRSGDISMKIYDPNNFPSSCPCKEAYDQVPLTADKWDYARLIEYGDGPGGRFIGCRLWNYHQSSFLVAEETEYVSDTTQGEYTCWADFRNPRVDSRRNSRDFDGFVAYDDCLKIIQDKGREMYRNGGGVIQRLWINTNLFGE